MIAYHQTLAILLKIDDESMLTLAKLCLLHSRSLLHQNQGNMTDCLMECVMKKQCRLACFGALSKMETFSHGYEKTTVGLFLYHTCKLESPRSECAETAWWFVRSVRSEVRTEVAHGERPNPPSWT